jgi:hypothetical protein
VRTYGIRRSVLSVVGDIPWRIGHGSEKFRLVALDDCYFGFGGAAPQLNSVCPNRCSTNGLSNVMF